jgi:hypothetical protein
MLVPMSILGRIGTDTPEPVFRPPIFGRSDRWPTSFGRGFPPTVLYGHDADVAYQERASRVPGVVVWQKDARQWPSTSRILPDGCMDLIWDGSRLFVAGPDTRARWHATGPNITYIGLRFSRGMGPGLLDTPADVVCDLNPDLQSLWPSRRARVLAEQVADGAGDALEAWLVSRVAHGSPLDWGLSSSSSRPAGRQWRRWPTVSALVSVSSTGDAVAYSARGPSTWPASSAWGGRWTLPGLAYRWLRWQ